MKHKKYLHREVSSDITGSDVANDVRRWRNAPENEQIQRREDLLAKLDYDELIVDVLLDFGKEHGAIKLMDVIGVGSVSSRKVLYERLNIPFIEDSPIQAVRISLRDRVHDVVETLLTRHSSSMYEQIRGELIKGLLRDFDVTEEALNTQIDAEMKKSVEGTRRTRIRPRVKSNTHTIKRLR